MGWFGPSGNCGCCGQVCSGPCLNASDIEVTQDISQIDIVLASIPNVIWGGMINSNEQFFSLTGFQNFHGTYALTPSTAPSCIYQQSGTLSPSLFTATRYYLALPPSCDQMNYFQFPSTIQNAGFIAVWDKTTANDLVSGPGGLVRQGLSIRFVFDITYEITNLLVGPFPNGTYFETITFEYYAEDLGFKCAGGNLVGFGFNEPSCVWSQNTYLSASTYAVS